MLMNIAGTVVAVTAIALFGFSGSASATIYWDSGADIARANLDGSLFDSTFIRTRADHSCGIDVDSTHVYWADANSDAIGRARLDGSEVDDDFVRPAGDLPCDVVVDSSFVYWANMAGDTIGRARLDGSDADSDFIVTAEHPCGLAVNRNAIYWSSNQEGMIWRTDIAGLNGAEVVLDDAPTPCPLALSETHIYWGEYDFKRIGRAKLDGSDASLEFIATSNYPGGLDIHADSLYWTNTGYGVKSISRANLDGGNIEPELLVGLDYPNGLAVDGRWLQASPVTRNPPSELRIARVKRNRHNGTIFIGVGLAGAGLLYAATRNRQVDLSPKGFHGYRHAGPGLTWLKMAPRSREGRGKCFRKPPRRGKRIEVILELVFTEADREEVRVERRVTLYRRGCSTRSHGRRMAETK